jgi:hypothetical protein
LVDNPTKIKEEWPCWKENGGRIERVYNHCFACQENKDIEHDFILDCGSCMLIWPNEEDPDSGNVICEQKDSPYKKWLSNDREEEVIRNAIIIRDLPIREKDN